MHHTLQDVLVRKSPVLAVMDANDNLDEAAARMNRLDVGAMVILCGGGFVGVLSDRDVLKWVGSGKRLADVLIVEALPSDNVVAEVGTTVREALELMTQHRRRHLAVLAAGQPMGLVSIGDLLHFVADDLGGLVTDLVSYIHGPSAWVDTYVSQQHLPESSPDP